MAGRNTVWIRVAILALAGWPGGLAADGALPPNAGDRAALARFKRLDHDGALALPPDALASRRAAGDVFALLDRNGDTRLTAADGAPARAVLRQSRATELSAGQFARIAPGRWIAALDNDGDGRLGLAELRPSLAGNAPLDQARRQIPRPEPVSPPSRPQSCWFYDGTRWVALPAADVTCRRR